MPVGTIWELGLGDEVISTIRETGYEYPWIHGEFADPAKFDRFRIYFRPDEECPESAEFESLLEEIDDRGRFSLRNTATDERYDTVHPFNHDSGTGVWFRLCR